MTHRRGCLMRCQSRNRRPSATSCFQRPTSYAFHQPHPAAHRTTSYPENPGRLGLRKTFLNGLDDSPAKVFLSFSGQRASILFFHAQTLPHYFVNVTYIMLRLVSPPSPNSNRIERWNGDDSVSLLCSAAKRSDFSTVLYPAFKPSNSC